MAKLTKKQKVAASKIEKNKLYSLKDASALIKEVASAQFDESVDIAVKLGVDPRKAVSYTHLDVYKRQIYYRGNWIFR